jgi:hypothetical protein
VKTLAFADDLAVLITAHNADLAEKLMNEALALIDNWMTVNGLAITPEKSECVVLTGKHSFVLPHPVFKGVRILVLRDIRYLGVQLDTRLSFGAHAGKVIASARKAAVALGRLMPNVGGPSQSKRSLLMSVVHSRLLYGAPTWARVRPHQSPTSGGSTKRRAVLPVGLPAVLGERTPYKF